MAIAYDSSSVYYHSTAKTLTLTNYQVGSDTNRILLAMVTVYTGTSHASVPVTGITFNTSQNFSYIDEIDYTDPSDGNSHSHVELWGLVNPNNAKASVVASCGSSDLLFMNVISFTGADQNLPTNYTKSTGQTPASGSLTTLANGSIVAGLWATDDWDVASDSLNYGASQLIKAQNLAHWATIDIQSVATAGLVNNTIATTGGADYAGAYFMIEVKAYGVAPGGWANTINNVSSPGEVNGVLGTAISTINGI